MEVCGGQAHSIGKHGIDRLLPEGIELVQLLERSVALLRRAGFEVFSH